MEIIRKVKVDGMVVGGPYSLAIGSSNLLFVSGQGGFTTIGKDISDDIREQTLQAFQNIEKILVAACSSVKKILKTTVFLKNIEDFPKMNEAYAEFFKRRGRDVNYPARTTISAQLPLEQMKVEIEVIALS